MQPERPLVSLNAARVPTTHATCPCFMTRCHARFCGRGRASRTTRALGAAISAVATRNTSTRLPRAPKRPAAADRTSSTRIEHQNLLLHAVSESAPWSAVECEGHAGVGYDGSPLRRNCWRRGGCGERYAKDVGVRRIGRAGVLATTLLTGCRTDNCEVTPRRNKIYV